MNFKELMDLYGVAAPINEAVMPKAVELVQRADTTIGKTMDRLGRLLSGKKADDEKLKTGGQPPADQEAPQDQTTQPPLAAKPPVDKTAPIQPPVPKPAPTPPSAPTPPAVPPTPVPPAVPVPPATPAPSKPAVPAEPPKVSGKTPSIPEPVVPKSMEELKKPGVPAQQAKPVDWMVSKAKLFPEIAAVIRSYSSKGDVIVNFRKTDDTLRRIYCTTNMTRIPSDKHPKGLKKPSPGVMAVYDLEKNDWRSFVLQRVIDMTPVIGKDASGKPILGKKVIFNEDESAAVPE